jgi:PAS domain S-box-containing protein
MYGAYLKFFQQRPSTMDRILVRNYALFFLILVICTGTLIYILIAGERAIEKTAYQVSHTHSVITEAEQLSTLIESMLAAQRGYIITGNKDFLDEYAARRDKVSELIAALSELSADNLSQTSRLDEIRLHFNDFSAKLEERAQRFGPANITTSKAVLDDIEVIDNLKNSIIRINSAVLEEEYGLLDERIQAVEAQKSKYFIALLVGVVIAAAMLLLFNGFLLHAQRRRGMIAASLKDTEDRFALAIDGTQDGIFDWNIQTDEVFYSGRFHEMLGYDRKAFTGTTEDFKALLHPDDSERVWAHVQEYLKGELPEYTQEFRMKNKAGRWVWIQARAKALYREDGTAFRMVGAHTDISHLKKAQEKLETEKKQAEESNRLKSEFLAHMSHEIRTPLTAISGIAEIFERSQDNFSEKQQKLVGTLLSSTASLKDLINDILDFSKIESGELELDESSFRLDELFEQTISIMSMRASEKGISFVFDYHELQDSEFYGDNKRIRQILVNLLGNAIKFTDNGGVSVKAVFEERDDNQYLRVDVADTGIGIEPENFDLVFERFKQADSSVSRKYGGTGLGLPISKNLAQLMGGDIFLSSEYGKGSTFTILLPVKVLAPKKSNQAGSKDVIKKLNDNIKSVISTETKALIVEDYEGNVLVIGYMLDDLGLAYDVARTGRIAVDLWKNNHYDVVLMDIQMPEMDGFAATKEIRRIEKEKNLSHTPIIGMTAHALVGDKDKCIEAGMDAYLPKPLVEATLKEKILRYLDGHKDAA